MSAAAEPADRADGAADTHDADLAAIDHGDLRPVIDFALAVAAEGRRRRPPLAFPDALKPFLDGQHVSRRSLARLRRALQDDPVFRSRLAAGLAHETTEGLVDDLGTLWLTRPDGWQAAAEQLIEERSSAAALAEDERAARREEKRRIAAERARDRAEADLAERDRRIERLRTEVDDLRTDLAKMVEEAAEQRVELQDARLELRHARDRERSALERLERSERDRDAAEQASEHSAEVRDGVLADRVDSVTDVAGIVAAADAAAVLADQLRSLIPSSDPVTDRPDHRTPMALPGGVIASSAEAAEFFARSDAAILVDGYNVSKLVWSGRSLEQQRTALLDAVENVARRFGTDVTVVFDGADVVGAHAARRRLVRVVYSPDGVTADDVIRDEVRRLPSSRHVVVVTNDKEIVRDVRSWGANPLPSNALVAVL